MRALRNMRWWSVAVAALTLPGLAFAGGVELSFDGSTSQLSLAGQAPFHSTSQPLLDLETVAVPNSSALLVVWQELSAGGDATPYYAISLDGNNVERVTSTTYLLKLRHGDFDPLESVPAPAGGLAADATGNLYIVQYKTQIITPFHEQLESAGVTIYKFLPHHANIVRMTPEVRDEVAALPFVRWVGPYHPAYRLDDFMRDNLAAAEQVYPLQRYVIRVWDGASQKSPVAAKLRAIGGQIDNPDWDKHLLIATLTPSQLFELVTWDEVAFVDPWTPYEDDMNNARELGGANYLETQTGYTGLGLRGEVFDSGFNEAHVDFQHHPLIRHTQVDTSSHGASTSGICFGDGTGNPLARGMLPEGQGVIADYGYVDWEGPGRYTHIGQTVNDFQCVFTTCSFGSGQTTAYTNISAAMDDALFDFDHAHTQSQSNTGNRNSRPQAWAKNMISGGAAYHYDTLTMADDRWNGGASIGPATDGRIKPTLCAFYDQILTTTSGGTNAYTTGFGGTSGATPIIAGHLGLFFQMWADGIFGNEVNPNGTIFENRSHMTTAKAMLVNNATQYPFSGAGHDLTRVHQGWGWPNLKRMYDMREKMVVVNEDKVLKELEIAEYLLTVPPNEPEFRATLVYADPAGTPGAAKHRINDLTLKVTTPNNTVYWGNNGLLTENLSAPGGSANDVDTVENVFIQNPAPGPWKVEIIAAEINEDSHVETPEKDADFALVVTGVLSCSSAGVLTIDADVYSCTGRVTAQVIDCDLNQNPNVVEQVDITVKSDSEPGGEIVTLIETGEATAAFVGVIDLSDTNAPGVLLVADGDVITVEYYDEDNGQGVPVWVRAYADVDCAAPTIENVQATPTNNSMTVAFDSNELVIATVYYGTACNNLDKQVSSTTPSMTPEVLIENLTPTTKYYFAVEAVDHVNNKTYDNNGGSCYMVKTLVGPGPVYFWDLNTDPGWMTQGQWAYGKPTGQGGEHGGPDPTAGYTGDNVYGYNLNGDYTLNMPEYHLTTTAFDCSKVTDAKLRFQRWLGVEQNAYDHAYICISTNGSNWQQLWQNPAVETADTNWVSVEYDISAWADGQPTVYIRWTMGTTDNSWVYCGWNIDDVIIWGILPEFEIGDLNCDGEVDFGDINPFVLALTDPQGYNNTYPDCDVNLADINEDGKVDFNDINPFVDLLTTP